MLLRPTPPPLLPSNLPLSPLIPCMRRLLHLCSRLPLKIGSPLPLRHGRCSVALFPPSRSTTLVFFCVPVCACGGTAGAISSQWSIVLIPVWLLLLLFAFIPCSNWSLTDNGDGKRLYKLMAVGC